MVHSDWNVTRQPEAEAPCSVSGAAVRIKHSFTRPGCDPGEFLGIDRVPRCPSGYNLSQVGEQAFVTRSSSGCTGRSARRSTSTSSMTTTGPERSSGVPRALQPRTTTFVAAVLRPVDYYGGNPEALMTERCRRLAQARELRKQENIKLLQRLIAFPNDGTVTYSKKQSFLF